MTTLAGIELGGTKSIAVLSVDGTIVERFQLPTGEPRTTLAALIDRVAGWHAARPVAAIGVASFGPLALDPSDPAFGRITTTPKPGWAGVDVRGAFATRFAVPIGFDTDVAGAALAEGAIGAARGCRDFVYLTIGTGVGAGIVANGRLVHGRVHPEVGHVLIRRVPGDAFGGACPVHGDCLEGLVAGPALAARTGIAGHAIGDDHPVWHDVAADLAQLMATLILTLAPERIIVGGGVANRRPHLLPLVRSATARLLAGYLPAFDRRSLDDVLTSPALNDDAGPVGALQIAADAVKRIRAGTTDAPRQGDAATDARVRADQ